MQSAEPTDRDYLDGRARFTSLAEFSTTGRRLAWREDRVAEDLATGALCVEQVPGCACEVER